MASRAEAKLGEQLGAKEMSLTDLEIRNARPRDRLFKMSDGGGLQLWVRPSGSRSWCLAYEFGGKQRKITFGPYPAVRLQEARDRREEAKKLLREGVWTLASKSA